MYKSHYSVATSTNTIAAVDSLLARKIDNATAGLRPFLAKALCRLSEDNAGTITDYIQSLNEEINASNNYRRNVIAILCSFSEYNNKPFRQITREDILAFLDSFRRPESIDPQHKWIGTYNLYRVNLIRSSNGFFILR